MENYNYNENELVLLNDKHVANSLTDSTTTEYGVPTIPSQKLFKESYDKLSSDDKSISDFIEDVISADLYKLSGQYEGTKTDVEISCNAISSLIGSISTDLSNTITSDVKHLDDLQISAAQISSKINSLCTQISNDLTAKYSWLSGEASRLCTELSDNVESKFVHKAGDSVKWLSVGSSLSTTLFRANTSGKAIPTDQFTDVVVDENGFKVDAIGEGRQIVLSTNNSTNDIIVNGSSLSDHIKSEVRISADEAIKTAKAYTDTEIQKLDVDDTAVAKQFVTAVSEADGKIHVQRAALISTDIPTISETQVSNLTEDLQNLSSNYVKVSDFKTKLIDNDGKFLSAEDFDLTYDSTTHDIMLKAGEKTYKFSAIEFIQSRTVHHIAVDTHDGKTWLKIYWTANDFIELDINELVKVYTFENGISSYIPDAGGEIHVGATSDLARTSYVNEISLRADTINASLQSEIERAKAAEAANTTAINTEKDRAEGAESANATAISNEKARAEGAENNLQRLLTAEETRANLAEAGLATSIGDEADRAKAAEAANTTAINTEKDRAVQKEAYLLEKIEAETERSKGEEVELKNAIDSETSRAKAAEAANTTAINTEKDRAEGVEGSLQTQINSVLTDLTAEVKARENADSEITTNVNAVSSDVISLKTYATELSGSSPDNIGIIATLSNSIMTLQSDIIKELKFVNHIRIGNDTPVTTISDFFNDQKLAVKDGNKVANGSIYDVQFVDGSDYSTSSTYQVEDLSLGLGDYLIVHDHNNDAFVSIADLHATGENKNLYVLKAGTSRYEFENAYAWLSGETSRLCIAISTAVDLSASALCTELCACELSVDGISTAVALSAAALCTEISNLSDEVSAISNDLSSAISSKIWIKDLNDDGSTLTAGNMDALSVIKITKDDFDAQVATGTLTMSSNTLYVVSSDYMDAYGQQLCNLTMTEDMVASEATNKHYVDAKDGKLATDINAVSSSVEVIKNKFNDDTIATDPVLAKLLENKNDSDISTVISAVMYIFNALTQV